MNLELYCTLICYFELIYIDITLSNEGLRGIDIISSITLWKEVESSGINYSPFNWRHTANIEKKHGDHSYLFCFSSEGNISDSYWRDWSFVKASKMSLSFSFENPIHFQNNVCPVKRIVWSFFLVKAFSLSKLIKKFSGSTAQLAHCGWSGEA